MMRPAALVLGLCMSVVFGTGMALFAQQVTTSPASPPVLSVNGGKGNVTVPTVQRQSSTALDASSGTVTWTFPATFTNAPTCYTSVASTSTTYSFDTPIVTAISATNVSVKLTAHPAALTIASLTLPISLPLTASPPAGTTVTLTCVGALP